MSVSCRYLRLGEWCADDVAQGSLASVTEAQKVLELPLAAMRRGTVLQCIRSSGRGGD